MYTYRPISTKPEDSFQRYKSGLCDANFDALKDVVNVNLMNKNLISFCGDTLHKEGPSVISERDPIDETLVSLFHWFVEKAQS